MKISLLWQKWAARADWSRMESSTGAGLVGVRKSKLARVPAACPRSAGASRANWTRNPVARLQRG
jgi:hypothetical protein